MKIYLNIEAESPAELQEAIAGLAGTSVAPAPQADAPEKPKRNTKPASKPSKAEPEEKEEAGNTPEEAETGTEEESDTDSENVPTDVELRAAATEIIKADKSKQPKVKALLDEFEVKNITAVPDNKRIEFMARLKKL